jgi:hypothetical protein
MWVIEDIEQYVELSLSPKDRIKKTNTFLFDQYNDSIQLIYESFWLKNWFIDILLNKWIISKPVIVYSPRKTKTKQTDKKISNWMYRNSRWHIYYIPEEYNTEDAMKFFKENREKLFIGIRLSDALMWLHLAWKLTEFIETNKDLLSERLKLWNLSESESTTE